MKLSPSQVKNLMRRGLRYILDPEPEAGEKQQLREYFENRCAYCDKPITKLEGDIDHLISASLGGANGLSNRVLSCKPCNAQEKRDLDWQHFIKVKCVQKDILEKRILKIENWIQKNGGSPVLDTEHLALLELEAKRTTAEYDIACKRIKENSRT